MQIQIQGLLQFSTPFFPTAQVTGPPGRAVYTSAGAQHISLSTLSRPAERPSGDPATLELHRVQRAPADRPARLPGAAQGTRGVRALLL